MGNAKAIARHDLRVLRRDPLGIVIFTVMPLVVMAFMRPTFERALRFEGHNGANGAEQAVPGMVTMFAFFLVAHLAFTFFREHGWNTWDRLRATPMTQSELLAGKLVVPLIESGFQIVVLFTLGGLVFRLHIRGSVLGVALIAVALCICVVTFALALTALLRSMIQLNALANLLALLLAGFGGALSPLGSLPGWARAVAPATPTYWAMRGFRAVILDGKGLTSALPSVAMLMVFTAIFSAVAAARFRFNESKISWA
jgi:ABC-2 type transport system permease protein